MKFPILLLASLHFADAKSTVEDEVDFSHLDNMPDFLSDDPTCPMGACHQGEVDVESNSTRIQFEHVGSIIFPGAFLPVVVQVDWKRYRKTIGKTLEGFQLTVNSVLEMDNVTTPRSIKHCGANINRTIDSIDALFDWSDTTNDLRSSRGAIEVIADLLGFGMIFSNQHKISQMVEREDTLLHNQDTDHKALERVRTESLKALRRMGDKVDRLAILADLDSSCQLLYQHINELYMGFYTGLQGEIQPSMISVAELKTVTKRVKDKLRRLGSKTLFPDHTLLLQATRATHLDRGTMRTVFLVPFVDIKVHKMALWAHHPEPIQREGHQLILDLADHYLAVNQEPRAFAAFTSAQLAEYCVKVKDTYVCKGPRTMDRKAKTCLTALYLGDSKAVHELCHFVKTQHKWVDRDIIKQSDDRFFTTSWAKVDLVCGRGKRTQMSWPLGSVQQVAKDCYAKAKDFVILPQPVELKGEFFEATSELNMKAVDHDIYSHRSLENSLAGLMVKTPELERLQDIASSWWIWVIVGLAILIVCVAAVGAAGYAFWRLHKRWIVRAAEVALDPMNPLPLDELFEDEPDQERRQEEEHHSETVNLPEKAELYASVKKRRQHIPVPKVKPESSEEAPNGENVLAQQAVLMIQRLRAHAGAVPKEAVV